MEDQVSGYHIREISKGVLGQSSKIREELEELEDGEDQGNKILMLCELSDLIGAIDAYRQYHFGNNISFDDLVKMSKATTRAFESGSRK